MVQGTRRGNVARPRDRLRVLRKRTTTTIAAAVVAAAPVPCRLSLLIDSIEHDD